MSTIELSRFQHASDRRVQRTICAIHEAFLKLAAEQNMSKITVAAVSEAANINRKTFYLHYKSIDDLVDEILYDEVLHLSNILNEECFGEDGSIDVPKMFVLLGAEMVRSLNEHSEIYRHTDTRWLLVHLEPILTEEIIRNDSFKLANHLGPYLRYCVTYFCSGLLSVYRQWIDNDSELPMEDLALIMSAAIEGGITQIIQTRKPIIENEREIRGLFRA